MKPLSNLLTVQHDKFVYEGLEDGIRTIGLNIWLIHVSQSTKTNESSLPKLLTSAHLRLDSHVFGFYEGNLGFIIN